MNETLENTRDDLLAELTAEVVAAYVSNNVVQTGDLPGLIANVHSALGSTTAAEIPAEKPKPSAPLTAARLRKSW